MPGVVESYKIVRVLRAARDAFFCTYTARAATSNGALLFSIRYGTYGAICLRIELA